VLAELGLTIRAYGQDAEHDPSRTAIIHFYASPRRTYAFVMNAKLRGLPLNERLRRLEALWYELHGSGLGSDFLDDVPNRLA